MSVDPAAVRAGSGVTAAAVEALIQAEMDALAADAQALASKVTTGQVVTAQVLPSNGLTDLISILGSRVAAQLPPTLTPGDIFTAQVTGFNGPQILLQVLSAGEAPPLAETPSPGNAPAPESPLTALQAAATRPALPEGVTPSVAPPSAVFVAASVRPSPQPAAPPQPSSLASQPQAVVLADIEARIAAARASAFPLNIPAAPQAATPTPPPPGVATAAQQPASAAPEAPVAPPPAPTPQTPVPFSIPGRYTPPPQITASPQSANQPTANAPQAPPTAAGFRDPLPLVRALGLPVTPTNLAAAKLALNTPQRLPAALATLESALPNSDDSRISTLRTLTAWIGKLDPQSPQLAAQISSYVDNVVTGNETKLAQLLNAQLTADRFAAAPPPATAAAAAATAANGAAPAAPAAVPVPTLPVVALAQIVANSAALGVDLKTQILALINRPPPGDIGDFVPAASAALSAITSVQLNAAQAMNATPQTMAFTLPMFLGQGYAQARVAIDRDAPQQGGSRALDGDNFHIAFVLDTKHLGTVTVDLQTVGRAFSLAVKTENERSATRFGDALGRLTDRLETLRYRVNSAEATVASRGSHTPSPLEIADDGIQSDVNVRA